MYHKSELEKVEQEIERHDVNLRAARRKREDILKKYLRDCGWEIRPLYRDTYTETLAMFPTNGRWCSLEKALVYQRGLEKRRKAKA